MSKKEYHINYGGKDVTIEVGGIARQADGSAFVTCEGTQVLVTVCAAKTVKDGQDFFPLMVDYREKFFAAGKFLGGFRKREGRPSDSEVLLARMIDRPFRPLFPEGFMAETIISANVLSYDTNADPEVLAGLGASAALAVSDIPFDGPVGFCKVAKIDGKLVLNPSVQEWDSSDLELVVAGTKDAVSMIEGECNEYPEEELLEAILFGHEYVKTFCDFINKIKEEKGKSVRDWTPLLSNKKVAEKVKELFSDKARAALEISDKITRRDAVENIEHEVAKAMAEAPEVYSLSEGDSFSKEAYLAVDKMLYDMMRGDILNEEKRIGGRSLTEVRPIVTQAPFLKKVHGSSLFTRGETQVVAAVTMGGREGEQMVDYLHGQDFDRFYLHYTFAPYCVGEARGYRGVGRREIGHGNLAQRALAHAMPDYEKFPYTVRVACEVLESNGSSSMASVCSGSMALMEAGVPLKGAVAGVAMGMVKDGDNFKILTDILGDEDHLGDMDFKVAGTDKGITAIQMDIKISGITKEIFEQALSQAKEGRMHILGEMSKTISTGRENFKEGVPRIRTVKIDPDKIGAFIGPGGKHIKAFQEEHNLTAEVSDDGTIKLLGTSQEGLTAAQAAVELQINGPKPGSDYDATVVSIKEYGAFVDIAPNVSGLLHVSEITDGRVSDVNDYLAAGDIIKVRVMDVDRFGKIKFSAKAIKGLPKKED